MVDRSALSTIKVRRRAPSDGTSSHVALIGAVGIVILAAVASDTAGGGSPLAFANRISRHTFQPTALPSPARPPGLIALPTRTATSDPRLLYDATPDGRLAAYRDAWSGPGPLHLVGADGWTEDLILGPVDTHAPLAAAFSPDGRTLAIVDGAGALWSVEVSSRAATRVPMAEGTGPFGRSIRFGDATHVFVQVVGSVEIPIPSHIAVVSLPDGAVTRLSDDPAAFGPRPLMDGSVAYLHLNADGSYVVRRVGSSGAAADVAAVGFAHGWVDISIAGAVAYSDGATTWLVASAGARPVRIGAGAYPRFGPDGRAFTTFDASRRRTELYALDGTPLESVDSPFATAGCAEGC